MAKTVDNLYREAEGTWAGWDWAQSFGTIDENCPFCGGMPSCGGQIVFDGLGPEPDDGACEHYRAAYAEAEEYDEQCESDAAAAEALAAEAMAAIADGRHADALAAADDVIRIEATYGDAPTWRAWRDAVDSLTG